MAMEEDKAAVDRIIRNHAFYGDEATEILNLCTAKDATIAALKAEVERLKSKVNPCPFCSSFYELDALHQLLKDGVASLKSRAESAEAKLEKVRLIVDDERTGDISAFTAFLRVKAIIGEGEK